MESLVKQQSERWEWVAVALLYDLGCVDSAPDALQLATACGLRPLPWGESHASLLPGGELRYPAAAAPREQQRVVARKLARWALARHELEATAPSVEHVALALRFPAICFRHNLAEHGWNVQQVRDLHYPLASYWDLARRVTAVQDAAVMIYDHGRPEARRVSAAYRDVWPAPTHFENTLAELALESDLPVQAPSRLWAYPLRLRPNAVLTLCDAEQLRVRTDASA